MTKKIVPIKQLIEEAENSNDLFIDPEDVIEVDSDDLDDAQDDEEKA